MSTQIKIDLTCEMIENIIVTAYEGGSNYWLDWVEHEKLKGDDPYTMRLAKRLFEDGRFTVRIKDCETGEHLGVLSRANIVKGLEIAATKFPQAFANLMSEDYDAGTADVLLQLSIMGDVLYG